jgi:hypothetical protein
LPFIIGIQESDKRSPGFLDAPVPRRADPRIGLSDQSDARVPEAFRDDSPSVGGAIIHDKAFKIGE